MAKKMRVEVAWISGAVVSFAAFGKKAVRFNSSNLFRRSRNATKQHWILGIFKRFSYTLDGIPKPRESFRMASEAKNKT